VSPSKFHPCSTLMVRGEEKDEFYQLLSESLSIIPKGDELVLAGDFNARVGAEYNQWNGAIGPHSVSKMNENGQRLLELCTNYNLALTNTFFASCPNSKVTSGCIHGLVTGTIWTMSLFGEDN